MLLTLIPVHVPCFAVFTDDNGEPEFRVVVSIGLIEAERNKRIACGFCVGDHIEPAESKVNFVAFSSTDDRDQWSKRCLGRREEMRREADETTKKPKLYVPERKVAGVHA